MCKRKPQGAARECNTAHSRRAYPFGRTLPPRKELQAPARSRAFWSGVRACGRCGPRRGSPEEPGVSGVALSRVSRVPAAALGRLSACAGERKGPSRARVCNLIQEWDSCISRDSFLNMASRSLRLQLPLSLTQDDDDLFGMGSFAETFITDEDLVRARRARGIAYNRRVLGGAVATSDATDEAAWPQGATNLNFDLCDERARRPPPSTSSARRAARTARLSRASTA